MDIPEPLDEPVDQIDPNEPELETDPLPADLPDDVRSGDDDAAYDHQPTEED